MFRLYPGYEFRQQTPVRLKEPEVLSAFKIGE